MIYIKTFTFLLLNTTIGWLPLSFFIIYQTFSVEYISVGFPGHFRMGIPLHSSNVLVLLEYGMHGLDHA